MFATIPDSSEILEHKRIARLARCDNFLCKNVVAIAAETSESLPNGFETPLGRLGAFHLKLGAKLEETVFYDPPIRFAQEKTFAGDGRDNDTTVDAMDGIFVLALGFWNGWFLDGRLDVDMQNPIVLERALKFRAARLHACETLCILIEAERNSLESAADHREVDALFVPVKFETACIESNALMLTLRTRSVLAEQTIHQLCRSLRYAASPQYL